MLMVRGMSLIKWMQPFGYSWGSKDDQRGSKHQVKEEHLFLTRTGILTALGPSVTFLRRAQRKHAPETYDAGLRGKGVPTGPGIAYVIYRLSQI